MTKGWMGWMGWMDWRLTGVAWSREEEDITTTELHGDIGPAGTEHAV